jgi:hypothetical protein
MTMKTCSECQFYVSIGEGKNGRDEIVQVGNCFRYPPAIQPSGASAYPIVGAPERACGDFVIAAKPARGKNRT